MSFIQTCAHIYILMYKKITHTSGDVQILVNIQICPLVGGGGGLVYDSSRLQEGIFVYTLVKLYSKANLV